MADIIIEAPKTTREQIKELRAIIKQTPFGLQRQRLENEAMRLRIISRKKREEDKELRKEQRKKEAQEKYFKRLSKAKEQRKQKREAEGKLSKEDYWRRYREIKAQQNKPTIEIRAQIRSEQERNRAIRQINHTTQAFQAKDITITRTAIDMRSLNTNDVRTQTYDYHLNILREYIKTMFKTIALPIKMGLTYKAIYKSPDNIEKEYVIPITKAENEYTLKDVLNQSDINSVINDRIEVIINRVGELNEHGSGFSWYKSVAAYLKTAPIRLSGSRYTNLPEWIKNKQCCINIKNEDNKCFIWSILAALNPVSKDPQRVSKYKEYEETLNMKGICYPVCPSDFEKFER